MVFDDDPALREDDLYFYSGEDAFKKAIEKSVYAIQKCEKLDVTKEEKRIIMME